MFKHIVMWKLQDIAEAQVKRKICRNEINAGSAQTEDQGDQFLEVGLTGQRRCGFLRYRIDH